MTSCTGMVARTRLRVGLAMIALPEGQALIRSGAATAMILFLGMRGMTRSMGAMVVTV